MRQALAAVLLSSLALAGCSGADEADETATQATQEALPAATGEGTEERLTFPPGATSTTVEGTVTGSAFVDYIANLREGQYLNVSLASIDGSATFNLIAPGQTDVAYFNGSASGNQFEGTVPATGDHRIRVYLQRAAASEGRSGDYRLEVIAQTVGASASSAPTQAAAPTRRGDPVRGPGGLEQQCIARVNDMTGGNVTGTNRIEESEAATAIFVNVEGAEAPWRCLGYRDGTIGEVMYTGSEGAL